MGPLPVAFSVVAAGTVAYNWGALLASVAGSPGTGPYIEDHHATSGDGRQPDAFADKFGSCKRPDRDDNAMG